jgi:hypothetical protein
MISRAAYFVRAACALVALGCSASHGVTDGTACTLEARAGITVDVRDSASNTPAGKGSRIIAQEGAVADTSQQTLFGDGPYGLVYERAGTYTLSVTQNGYQPWIKTGVQVTKGSCHVNGVAITARLQK